MMPPSRCWTLFRLPSTLMTPFATTAPFNGAVLAHRPNTPKNTKMMFQPTIAVAFMESLSGADGGFGADGTSVAGSNSSLSGLCAHRGTSKDFSFEGIDMRKPLRRLHLELDGRPA